MHKKILILVFLALSISILFFVYFFPKQKQLANKAIALPIDNLTTTAAEPMPDIFYAPVLVYHHVAPNETNSEHYVSPEMFEQQMEWLKNNNYNIISYNQLYETLTASSSLPNNPIVITFDDGNKDQYENALPILKKYNYPAMFFIETITIGKSQWMSWNMLHDLLKSGMEIGSHTVTHYNLPKKDTETIKYELTKSKQILEENLNIPIKFFAYPNGTHSQIVIDELINAGYKSAVTIRQDVLQNKTNSIYLVPRIYVTDNLNYFINRVKEPKKN